MFDVQTPICLDAFVVCSCRLYVVHRHSGNTHGMARRESVAQRGVARQLTCLFVGVCSVDIVPR